MQGPTSVFWDHLTPLALEAAWSDLASLVAAVPAEERAALAAAAPQGLRGYGTKVRTSGGGGLHPNHLGV
jgi:hypothetical protein